MNDAIRNSVRIDADGSVTFGRHQDVESILDEAKRSREVHSRGEVFHKIGIIPNTIIERWIVEDGLPLTALRGEEYTALIKRKLRDPDYAWLRATDKRF